MRPYEYSSELLRDAPTPQYHGTPDTETGGAVKRDSLANAPRYSVEQKRENASRHVGEMKYLGDDVKPGDESNDDHNTQHFPTSLQSPKRDDKKMNVGIDSPKRDDPPRVIVSRASSSYERPVSRSGVDRRAIEEATAYARARALSRPSSAMSEARPRTPVAMLPSRQSQVCLTAFFCLSYALFLCLGIQNMVSSTCFVKGFCCHDEERARISVMGREGGYL